MVLRGYRGHGSTAKSWNITLFSSSCDKDGNIVEALFGYRGQMWTLEKWGDVKRVSNGKYVTLCVLAMIVETEKEG